MQEGCVGSDSVLERIELANLDWGELRSNSCSESESSVTDDSDSDSSRSSGCLRLRSFANRCSGLHSNAMYFWVDEVCSSSESETEGSNMTQSGRLLPRHGGKRHLRATQQVETRYGAKCKCEKCPPAPPRRLSRLERLNEKIKTTADHVKASMKACDVNRILSDYPKMFKLLNSMENLGDDQPPAVFIRSCAALETYCKKMMDACPVGRRNEFRKLGEKVKKGNGPYQLQIGECGPAPICSSPQNSNPNHLESDELSSSAGSDSSVSNTSDDSSSDFDESDVSSSTSGEQRLAKGTRLIGNDRKHRSSANLLRWIHGVPCSHAKEAGKAEMNLLEAAPELEFPHFLLSSGEALAADFCKAHVAAEVRVQAAQELAQPPCCIELLSSNGSMVDSDLLRSLAGDVVTIVVDSKPLLQWMQKEIKKAPSFRLMNNTADREWADARDFAKHTMTCHRNGSGPCSLALPHRVLELTKSLRFSMITTFMCVVQLC